jgi:hypothetical protein
MFFVRGKATKSRIEASSEAALDAAIRELREDVELEEAKRDIAAELRKHGDQLELDREMPFFFCSL